MRDGESSASERRLEVRQANEQRALSLIGTETDAMRVCCECGDQECAAELTMSRNAYRSVRRRPGWFLVFGGHERPEAHRVASLDDTFVIVEPGAA